MTEKRNYDEIFKATFEPERLQELINKWDNEEVEHEFSREEILEIGRLEGRRRMQNLIDAEQLQRQFDELSK